MKLPSIAPQESDATSETTQLPTITTEGNFFEITDSDTAVMPKQKRSLRGLWISLGVLVAVLIITYVGFSVFFMSHFSFNTTVNGVNVAFQTADEVDEYLTTEINNYTIKLQAREDQSASVRAPDIGLSYVSDGQMGEILESQSPWVWPLTLLPDHEAAIKHVSVEFDDQKLTKVVSALPMMDPEQMRAPVDASLGYEGNAYVVSPGDIGTTLDAEKTIQVVSTAIDAGETEINLDEADVYIKQEIPADDPTLTADCELFNKCVPFRMVYILGDKKEVLDGYTTINWVDQNGEPPYTLDTDAVWNWVVEFAAKYDTLGTTRTIVNGFGEEKTVSGGTYGWEIDQDSEYYAILDAAEQKISEEREPYMLTYAAAYKEQDWGTTYVEVDISSQYMWYFVDGELWLESDVITGNPNNGNSTPEGVYYIFSKQEGATLRGPKQPDGSYEWESVVSYWMPFTYDGCGFHDAWWQSAFGGDLYFSRGSHGCVNMPPYLAGELFGMIEAETPVLIHY